MFQGTERWFDPDSFSVERGQEDPLVALTVRPSVGRFNQAIQHLRDPYRERTNRFKRLTIDGRDAVRFETVQTRDILYPAGTRTFGYVVNRDGTAFYIQTKRVRDVQMRYGRNKSVVDDVVRRLDFESGGS